MTSEIHSEIYLHLLKETSKKWEIFLIFVAFSEYLNFITYSFNSKAEFEEYLCPVCFELPIAPKEIYQCSQGHFLCNVCLKKIDKKCPTCRENWVNVPNLPARNRMAENLLQKMTVNSKSEPIENKRKNESGAMNNISQKKAKSSNSTSATTSIAVSDSQNTYTFTGKSFSEALISCSCIKSSTIVQAIR